MRIGVVMMQRDEGTLLRSWATYHSRLLGPENVFVIDNESTDPDTLGILDEISASGVAVSHCVAADFRKKGPIVSDLIGSHGEIDWFFPLDCDEFIGVAIDSRFVASRDAIEAELASADAAGKTFCRVRQSWWNIPMSSGAYWLPYRKAAAKPAEKPRFDTGFHMFSPEKGDLLDGAKSYAGAIAYAHFHNRPFNDVLKRARLKLRGRLKSFDEETLRTYKGEGEHLAKYFLMTEEEYLGRLRPPTIDLAPIFTSLGVEVPFSAASSGEVAMIPAADRDLPAREAAGPPPGPDQDPPAGESAGEPLAVAMRPEEIEFFKSLLMGKRSYLEYGCGGSTRIVVETDVPRITSIDSDADWIRKLRKVPEIAAAEKQRRLAFHHVDIGKVVAWGRPKNSKQFQRWPRYYSDIWRRADANYDVILVDGRFRVACALTCAVFADPKATIIVHDYALRPNYYVLEKYFDTVGAVGTMVALRPRSRLNMRAWALDMMTFALNSD